MVVIGGVIDWRIRKIPNWLTYPILLLSILWFSRLSLAIISVSLIFWLLFQNSIGGGDIKLASALYLWSEQYGWSMNWLPFSLVFALVALVLQLIILIFARAFKEESKSTYSGIWGRSIAFGPFMALGFVASNLTNYL